MGSLPCSNHVLDQTESSTNSSLSSQPSLPSVPSLTSSKYLKQITPSTHHNCIATINKGKGHSSYISSLVLSGKFLYSGSSNREIRAWNRDPSLIQDLNSDILVAITNSAVKSIVVSGDKIFSAHQDHKIRVWKIDNNKKSESNQTHKYYKCKAILPTFQDRFSRLFSPKNYVEVRRHKKCTWVHHVDAVSALAISQDGSLLYSVSWDRTFKVWRTSDFKCLESVSKAHDDAINAIALSKDGYVYTGSADKKIKVWKNLNGHNKKHSLMATLEKHKSAVNALALSTDGMVLYSGACDRSILVWDRYVGNDQNGHMVLVGALRGHTKAILCLGVVVMDMLCSGSADCTVRIWRRGVDKSYSCLSILEGHKRPVKSLIAAPLDCNKDKDAPDDSKSGGTSYLVYSGSLDCDIKLWKIWVPFLC